MFLLKSLNMYTKAATFIGIPLALLINEVSGDCLANEEFNGFFEINSETGRSQSIPRFESCCMKDVCGLQCPEPTPEPGPGYGIAVVVTFALSFIIGIGNLFQIKGSAENFFVAGRSLPLLVVVMTLAAQSLDSNSLLGNVDNSYKHSFWDGAVIPIGLGLSLIINGVFLADKVNMDNVLTLPDIFAKRYGKTVEILVSLATVTSFIMLLAGNLVGIGVITGYLWGINESGGIWIGSAVVWSYTVSGGLFSVAYTDVFQGAIGWVGCLATAYWFITNEENGAPPPSIGFPGYIYPDGIQEGGICDMYEGVPCPGDTNKCCYNEELWCPNGPPCARYDRGAYPFGDQQIYTGQMTDHLSLSPFPNAIFWNWATIVILAFGNVAALDFQARCMASKTPRNARLGCIFGGMVTIFVGIPFSYLGAIARIYYGPDSVHSEFEADSCSVALGLPTCAQWKPDSLAFLKLLTNQAPPFVGGVCLVGILAATMSTADGAILALGTVMSNNLFRHLESWLPSKAVTNENLLLVARISTLPLTVAATCIAAYYRKTGDANAAGATGYLLIVAFDIVFATVVVPLFGAFYTKKPSPRAALLSIIAGATTRVVMEFVLPKDGNLLLPYDDPEFLDYGPAASTLPPAFIDTNSTAGTWGPEVDTCYQETYRDFTGVDSLAAAIVSLLVFTLVQCLEHFKGKALFQFTGDVGYDKSKQDGSEKEMLDDWTTPVEVLFAVVGFVFLTFSVVIVIMNNTL